MHMTASHAKLGDGNGASKEAPATLGETLRRFAEERRSFWIVLSLTILFAAWEIAGRIPISFAFPTFFETVAAFVEMLGDGSMLRAYFLTLQPLVLGVLISAFVGIGVGVVMGLSDKAEWLLAPVFIVLQAAPMAALVPLVTFVYGIGLTAKTLAVIMLALPVIVLNSYKAVRHVNPSLVDMCRSFQGNRLQQIFKIIIPDASPVLFAGLRLGIAAGFIGVMLAELLITPTGIGDLITYHRSVANYAHMYAAVASIIAVSTLTLAGLQHIEMRFLRPEKRRK
ncbi:MAG: ABC transporter permease [Phyllobacterium sp.]